MGAAVVKRTGSGSEKGITQHADLHPPWGVEVGGVRVMGHSLLPSVFLSQPVETCLPVALPRPAVPASVTSAPISHVSPCEVCITPRPPPPLQMLRSLGPVWASGEHQTRLMCDETECSEPLRGLGARGGVWWE